MQSKQHYHMSNIPFPSPKNPEFTFIDLFAGIGGFRLGMNGVKGKCVFSSEWDVAAQKTYLFNFGEKPYGDITQKETKAFIPAQFDILCAGFPCQAFSIAGNRKGFEDKRGILFFDVATIIKTHKPKVVFLENVKNLYTHDKGNTFATIKDALTDMGYIVYHKVMNAMEYANVPQNRERLFIVCFDPKQVPNYSDFHFPEKLALSNSIHTCIDKSLQSTDFYYTKEQKYYTKLASAINSTETIYQWRRQYVRENKSNVCPTLTANMGTGGHNVPIILTEFGIRKLSPKECLNFQGFPKNYQFPNDIAKSKQYMQAGNSVVVPLIKKVCDQIYAVLCKNF